MGKSSKWGGLDIDGHPPASYGAGGGGRGTVERIPARFFSINSTIYRGDAPPRAFSPCLTPSHRFVLLSRKKAEALFAADGVVVGGCNFRQRPAEARALDASVRVRGCGGRQTDGGGQNPVTKHGYNPGPATGGVLPSVRTPVVEDGQICTVCKPHSAAAPAIPRFRLFLALSRRDSREVRPPGARLVFYWLRQPVGMLKIHVVVYLSTQIRRIGIKATSVRGPWRRRG